MVISGVNLPFIGSLSDQKGLSDELLVLLFWLVKYDLNNSSNYF